MDIRKQQDTRSYELTEMQRDRILQKLKERGCRITKQRLLIQDIILGQECSCCKEIYYKASRKDGHIGAATVYRLVNTLEEIGAISRKNMYKVSFSGDCQMENVCTVVLDDGTACHLSAKEWNNVLYAGMKSCGYLGGQQIASVTLNECLCDGKSC